MRSYRPDRMRRTLSAMPEKTVMTAEEFRAIAPKPKKRRKADPVKPVDLPPVRLEGGRIRIALPMPPMALSPNTRGHTIAKATLVKRFRALGMVRMRKALAGETIPLNRYGLAFFYEPRRRRDDDNFEGSVKAYRDGIADALGMNDRQLIKAALSTFAADRDLPRVEITLWHETSQP